MILGCRISEDMPPGGIFGIQNSKNFRNVLRIITVLNSPSYLLRRGFSPLDLIECGWRGIPRLAPIAIALNDVALESVHQDRVAQYQLL